MIYRITISDNDFWFLMDHILDYLSECFNTYVNTCQKSRYTTDIIKDIFAEFMSSMHIDEGISDYIMTRLKITTVPNILEENENGEVYYFEDINCRWIKQ